MCCTTLILELAAKGISDHFADSEMRVYLKLCEMLNERGVSFQMGDQYVF